MGSRERCSGESKAERATSAYGDGRGRTICRRLIYGVTTLAERMAVSARAQCNRHKS
ncbi:MAG: hypothetical protein OJF58_002623 [Enhydrobacter sp.]|nr:MAG: hypothetical protein OJF58_002623 [Enhydrobacter sp.]